MDRLHRYLRHLVVANCFALANLLLLGNLEAWCLSTLEASLRVVVAWTRWNLEPSTGAGGSGPLSASCNLNKTCRSGQSERSCSLSNCAGGLSESEALSRLQAHRHLRLHTTRSFTISRQAARITSGFHISTSSNGHLPRENHRLQCSR